MDASDFIFYTRLKKLLQAKLLEGDFVVSTSISAGGGSRSVSLTGREAILKELTTCDRKLTAFRRGGSASMEYPVWRT